MTKSGEQHVISFDFKNLPPWLFDNRWESGRNTKTVPFFFLLTCGSDCPGPSSLHIHHLPPRLWDRTPCSGEGGVSYLGASGRGQGGKWGRGSSGGLFRHRHGGAELKLPRKTNRTQVTCSLALHFSRPHVHTFTSQPSIPSMGNLRVHTSR